MSFTGKISFTVHLGFLELSAYVESSPFKFTPFDVHLAVDPLNWRERYCTGLDYKVDTLRTDVKVKLRVNECQQGFLTNLLGTTSNC